MKKIYHTYTRGNSYCETRWYEQDYYLCETEEEYQKKYAECKTEKKSVQERAVGSSYRLAILNSFILLEEGDIHANEYYYGHQWNGKSFDAYGFAVCRRLENSTHHEYYLKIGSVKNEKVSEAVGRENYYGS